MPNLSNEKELLEKVPLNSQKLRRLRREGRIPFLQVDRFTRLYDIEKVVEALANGTATRKTKNARTKRATTAK
jgi:hypothetical protein